MSLRVDDHRSNVLMHEAYMRVLTAEFEVRRKAQERKVQRAKSVMDKAALDLKTAPVRSAIQIENFRLTLEEARARHKEYVDQWKWFDDSERSAIRRLELDIKEQRLGLQRAERNLERMLVRAPFAGILVLQSIHRGGEMGQIQAGDQIHPGQSFAQVVDQRSMVVNADVNQVDAERLRLGFTARVRFDAYPDLELPARIVSIGIFANSSGFRRDYVKSIPVRLKFTELDRRVIPNFTVSADVTVAKEEQAAVAPLEGVFTDQPSGLPHVFVRAGTGWEKRFVELGLRNNIEVAVRDGLKPDEVIAVERPPTE
jgi:multidrug efflux pump subunit AcrA (membrane-fusion protein)